MYCYSMHDSMTSTLQNAARETDRNSSAGLRQFPLLYLLYSLLLNQPPERQTETPALDLVSFLHFTCCTRFSSTSHTLALRLHLHASGRERQRARLHSRSISWRQVAREACGNSDTPRERHSREAPRGRHSRERVSAWRERLMGVPSNLAEHNKYLILFVERITCSPRASGASTLTFLLLCLISTMT
jgi:hypothetical protein